MISEKIVINNDLLGVVAKYVVVQFLRKKTCVLTKICCVLLLFIAPEYVRCWWHTIKQISHAFFLFNIEIIHARVNNF